MEQVRTFLKDSFSGNVKGMGPAVAEMEFEERPNEPFVFFAADKTDPGAYNLPLYLMFADPMYNSGLILSPNMAKGFKFVIMDVNYTEGDKLIELNAPEELYDIAALQGTTSGMWWNQSGRGRQRHCSCCEHYTAPQYCRKNTPERTTRSCS